MTTAERALLLAVAKELKDRFDVLHTLIAAVEEEAAPKANLSGMDRIIANTDPDEIASMVEAEEKSCFTCAAYLGGNVAQCSFSRSCDSSLGYPLWQPKTSETSECSTCCGNGMISMGNGMYPDCPDCGGTGRK